MKMILRILSLFYAAFTVLMIVLLLTEPAIITGIWRFTTAMYLLVGAIYVIADAYDLGKF